MLLCCCRRKGASPMVDPNPHKAPVWIGKIHQPLLVFGCVGCRIFHPSTPSPNVLDRVACQSCRGQQLRTNGPGLCHQIRPLAPSSLGRPLPPKRSPPPRPAHHATGRLCPRVWSGKQWVYCLGPGQSRRFEPIWRRRIQRVVNLEGQCCGGTGPQLAARNRTRPECPGSDAECDTMRGGGRGKDASGPGRILLLFLLVQPRSKYLAGVRARQQDGSS